MKETANPPQKKFFSTSAEKLREFDSDCLAIAMSDSEIFLLLGDESDENLQSFFVSRIITTNPKHLDEFVETFDAVWRCSALMQFKKFLEERNINYSSLSFLENTRSVNPILPESGLQLS